MDGASAKQQTLRLCMAEVNIYVFLFYFFTQKSHKISLHLRQITVFDV